MSCFHNTHGARPSLTVILPKYLQEIMEEKRNLNKNKSKELREIHTHCSCIFINAFAVKIIVFIGRTMKFNANCLPDSLFIKPSKPPSLKCLWLQSLKKQQQLKIYKIYNDTSKV